MQSTEGSLESAWPLERLWHLWATVLPVRRKQ
jgi:hypothetical protein